MHEDASDATRSVAADEGVVVERSKARPPEWLALAPGVLTEVGPELRMVTKRSKLLNLRLGLTQTQTAALDAMRLAIAARVQSQLADIAPTSSEEAVRKWQRMVFDSTIAATSAEVVVKDVYYEAVNRRMGGATDAFSHYHVVAILTACPKDKIPTIYQDLARRLTATDDALWRPVAARLRQFVSETAW